MESDSGKDNERILAVSATAISKEVAAAHRLIPEINAHYKAFRKSSEDAVKNAISIGELLLKMKDALPHGEFISAVEQRCEFDIRWGQVCMKVAGGQEIIAKLEERPTTVEAAAKAISEHAPKAKSTAHLKSTSPQEKRTSENAAPATQSAAEDSRTFKNEDGEDLNEHVKDFKEPDEVAKPEPPAKAMFKDALEHVRQAILLVDKISNALGGGPSKRCRKHEYALAGLDNAHKELTEWKRGSKC